MVALGRHKARPYKSFWEESEGPPLADTERFPPFFYALGLMLLQKMLRRSSKHLAGMLSRGGIFTRF